MLFLKKNLLIITIGFLVCCNNQQIEQVWIKSCPKGTLQGFPPPDGTNEPRPDSFEKLQTWNKAFELYCGEGNRRLGNYLAWYGNGKLHYDEIWDGHPVSWKEYSPDGHQVLNITCENSLCSGIATWWRGETKAREGRVEGGRRVGIWQYWDLNGVKSEVQVDDKSVMAGLLGSRNVFLEPPSTSSLPEYLGEKISFNKDDVDIRITENSLFVDGKKVTVLPESIQNRRVLLSAKPVLKWENLSFIISELVNANCEIIALTVLDRELLEGPGGQIEEEYLGGIRLRFSSDYPELKVEDKIVIDSSLFECTGNCFSEENLELIEHPVSFAPTHNISFGELLKLAQKEVVYIKL